MYFVVFLCEAQRYAVIPCHWVRDENNEIWDRFVNRGLNSSQRYLCYWSSENNSEQYLGAPSVLINPNFAVPNNIQFPCNEATYVCRIIKFRVDFNRACQYRDGRRNEVPVIYNRARIFERPIPAFEYEGAPAVNVVEDNNNAQEQFEIADAIVNPHIAIADENPLGEQEREINGRDENQLLVPVEIAAEIVHPHVVNNLAESQEREMNGRDDNQLLVPAEIAAEIVRPHVVINVENLAEPQEREMNGHDNNQLLVPAEIAAEIVRPHVVINVENLAEPQEREMNGHDDNQLLVPAEIAAEIVRPIVTNVKELSGEEQERKIGTRDEFQLLVPVEIAGEIERPHAAIKDDENSVEPQEREMHGRDDGHSLELNNEVEIVSVDNDDRITKRNDVSRIISNNGELFVLREVGEVDDEESPTETAPKTEVIIDRATLNEIDNLFLNCGDYELESEHEVFDFDEAGACGGNAVDESKSTEGSADLDNIVYFDDEDDELVMTFKGVSIPNPINGRPVVLPAEFVKRENDRISGDWPYKEDGFGRKYHVGNEVLTIPKNSVDNLLLWSTHPLSERRVLDEKFVHVLLLCCIPKNERDEEGVKPPIKIFIEDLFRTRVNNDNRRFSLLAKYMKSFLKSQRALRS